MNNKLTILGALPALALVSLAAVASDGAVNITGEMTAQTCSINGTAADGARNIAVPLATISRSNLSTIGSVSGDTPFQIALSGCSQGTGSVRTRFEPGTSVDLATGELITSGPGSSAGLRIQLLNSDGTPINVGSSIASQNSALATIPASGAVTLNYVARYHRLSSTALAVGAVTSSVTYSLIYN
ncbi:fimbrial protein [Lysobacter sp. TAF61]|uniref:fimbrial protein n=1 Tax=Lysobacter sp. TAF61 TaxID=3233072 RepID=UPI003F9C29EC